MMSLYHWGEISPFQYSKTSSGRNSLMKCSVSMFAGFSSLFTTFSITSFKGVIFSGQFVLPQYFCFSLISKPPQAGQTQSKGLLHLGQCECLKNPSFAKPLHSKQTPTILTPPKTALKNFNTKEV